MGSGGSGAVPVTTHQLQRWTRPEGAGFSDSEGALHLLSSLECPRFQGGWAGLVGGHTQVDFRTKLQGVGKLHVHKEAERKEIGMGVNRSRNRKWSDQRYNSMEPQESGQAPMSQDN